MRVCLGSRAGNPGRRINAPEQVAATYLARSGHWKLPRLRATLSAPTLRPDGSLLQRPGYDVESQSWYDPCGIKFSAVPDKPTIEEARIALETLGEAFGTFPWDTPFDESVAISLVLTALVRRSLTAAPLGAITAPVMAPTAAAVIPFTKDKIAGFFPYFLK